MLNDTTDRIELTHFVVVLYTSPVYTVESISAVEQVLPSCVDLYNYRTIGIVQPTYVV